MTGQKSFEARAIFRTVLLGGFLGLFTLGGWTAAKPPVFGVDFLEENNPIVVTHLKSWGIHTGPSWGQKKIAFENGREFSDIPPREFLRAHTQLSHYRVVELDTPAQLGAFIAYRLLEKYNQHNEEMKITDLSQIKKLLDTPHFMESFIRFLHLQLTMITLTGLENAIVDASREKEGRMLDGSMYPVMLDPSIRKNNREFLQKIGKEADQAWKGVMSARHSVLR